MLTCHLPQGLSTVFEEILKQFQNMVLRNACPVTRSTYTAMTADILAATTKSKLLLKLPASPEEHDWRFRTPIIPSKLSPENWRDFVQYLYQDCPTESVFALEAAAKDRCRVFVERLEDSTDSNFWELDISQTIFANSGTCRYSQHPEHADHVLSSTGRFLATWSLEDSQSQSTIHCMMTSWSRALKLAQDEHAVSLTLKP